MPVTDGRITRSKYIGRSKVVTEVEMKQVYERLRKRSYRHISERGKLKSWWPFEHEAYVMGVRDALKELMR